MELTTNKIEKEIQTMHEAIQLNDMIEDNLDALIRMLQGIRMTVEKTNGAFKRSINAVEKFEETEDYTTADFNAEIIDDLDNLQQRSKLVFDNMQDNKGLENYSKAIGKLIQNLISGGSE